MGVRSVIQVSLKACFRKARPASLLRSFGALGPSRALAAYLLTIATAGVLVVLPSRATERAADQSATAAEPSKSKSQRTKRAQSTRNRGCTFTRTKRAMVTAVPTATTLVLDDGTVVRLRSIIAPAPTDVPRVKRAGQSRIGRSQSARRPTPKKSAQPSSAQWPIANTAHAHTAHLAMGRNVQIAASRRKIDRYGRVSGHVWLEGDDGQRIWLQSKLLADGMARFAPVRERTACALQLARAERRARAARRGLWALGAYRVRPARDPWPLRRFENTYQIVAGRVISANLSKGRLYLNFGRTWRTDFTALISKGQLRYFDRGPLDPRELAGRWVEVRGWIESRGGPLIKIEHTYQIRALKRRPRDTDNASPDSQTVDRVGSRQLRRQPTNRLRKRRGGPAQAGSKPRPVSPPRSRHLPVREIAPSGALDL